MNKVQMRANAADSEARRAIVMGATSGIGREVARCLAHEGWLVGIAGRRKELLDSLMAEEPRIVACRTVDVNDSDAPQQLMALVDDLGGMDLYFHSSGIGWQNMPLDTEKELLTVQTNCLGFTRLLTAAFHYFSETGRQGRLACITSIAGTKGLGAAPAYSATKRFQSHYLECLAQLARMRRLPISVTDIRPGFVATPLIAGSKFPMQLRADSVARSIVKAIDQGRSVKVVDWRYAMLTSVWRLLPRWLWVRLPVH